MRVNKRPITKSMPANRSIAQPKFIGRKQNRPISGCAKETPLFRKGNLSSSIESLKGFRLC